MTTFVDGPAQGQTLQLRRAPIFLRVTEKMEGRCGNARRLFDGLDQIDDAPEPGETLHAYVLAEKPGAKGGGFWPMAKYALVTEQPDQDIMRDNLDWQAWCQRQPRPVLE